MKVLRLSRFALIFIIVAGCNNINYKKAASGLNIIDADLLLIKSSSLKKGATEDLSNLNSNLYKLVVNGNDSLLWPIQFTNDEGEFIDEKFSKIIVEKIYKFTDNLYCLRGNFKCIINSGSGEIQSFTTLLVRISDGAIFDFQGHYPFLGSDYFGEYAQTDSAGNIYYYYLAVQKLSEMDNGTYSITQYLPDGQETQDYFIDRHGNCFYQNGTPELEVDWNDRVFLNKVKKAEGGIIENTSKPIKVMFTGSDGNTYSILREFSDYSGGYPLPADYMRMNIYRINVREEVSSTLVCSHICPADTYGYNYLYQSSSSGITIFFRNVTEYSTMGELFIESEMKSYYLFQPEDFGEESKTIFRVIGDYSFMYGPNKKSVYRISNDLITPASRNLDGVTFEGYALNSYIEFVFPEGIEIYSFELIDEDHVLFTGLNLSEEENVIGTISSDGELTIVERTGNDSFDILTRLN